ncbi:unnamed protein product [Durusdinium trenchii]|uniref:Cation-transporting P-type ATPase N-terminal domain-containing protein n=1 Tax=Durusdinium trenchii TaxID=1381693 RepID=A0ABP0PAZ9_9DINO
MAPRRRPLTSFGLLAVAGWLGRAFVAPAGPPSRPPARRAAGATVLEVTPTVALPDEAHAVSEKAVLDFFNVTLDRGLSPEQVNQQLNQYGSNQLLEQEKKSLWELVAEQFDDLLVRILLLSALVSFLLAYFNTDQKEEGLSAYIEPLVILMILVLNACVGVWQESNAEKALDSLKKLQSDTATVLRGGRWGQIDATEVVPGDVCEVKAGDKVPADIRLVRLKTTTVRAEQSQLTGETQSVIKDPEVVDDPQVVLQGKNNMLFASTTISNGACVGCVVATGMSTEIGAIQGAVTEAAGEKDPTPLQKKLDEFGNTLARIIFAICVIVWLINYKHFFDPVHGSFLQGCIYYFKIAVALAVAAIPEGLPAVVTTCLALGTQQMAERNAIVRKLPSVETLGCTTVICSDKTGTLTLNEMCCTKLVLPESAEEMRAFTVDGNGYSPIGEVKDFPIDFERHKALGFFCKVAALCNESRLSLEGGAIVRTGEPTEAALRVLVEKLGCPEEQMATAHLKQERDRDSIMVFNDYWRQNVEKRATLEFARDRKSMSVLCNDPKVQAENLLYVKGAPESILDRCSSIMLPDGTLKPLSENARQAVLGKMLDMAGEALRTLALAVKFDLKDSQLQDYDGPTHVGHSKLCDPSNFAQVEQNMAFLGMVGIIDPPRPECMDAITACKEAGISVFMTTGDNKATAEAISRQLGILSPDSDLSVKSLGGREFEEMPEAQRAQVLRRMMADRGKEGAVFSRMEPKHKQIVVKMLKEQDEIVAMTGDGVNDAPALKQADIGVAMGLGGTEVAKEASDMVLANDNFSSIVAAVEQGRSIFKNMKAVIRYLISSNIGEVASIFLTAALGIPESLASVQLLWVNLVTDGLPATALGFNPPDEGVMSEPPRRKDDGLISGWALFRYLMIGLYVGLAMVGVFIYWFTADPEPGHTLVSLDQLMNWGVCSSWEPSFSAVPMMGLDFSADPCSYFTVGKVKAATLSITVLVMIQLLNAFNAVSEDGSLLTRPPWLNPYLVTACAISAALHCLILYTPLAQIFGVCPLDAHDWVLVAAFSLPVLILDELLKYISRQRSEDSSD